MLFKSNLKGEGRTFEVRVERSEIGEGTPWKREGGGAGEEGFKRRE